MTYRDKRPPSFLVPAMTLCILCGALGAILSESAFGAEIGKQNSTWIFGVFVGAIGVIVLPIVSWATNGSQSVYRFGTNVAAAFAAGSYIFCTMAISPFMVITMDRWIRIAGLSFFIVGNIWWCAQFARLYHMIYLDKSLFLSLYVDAGDFFLLVPERDGKVIEGKLKFDQMRPALLLIPVVPLAPLSLALEKILTPAVGFGGLWTFAAFIAIPLSMMLNGALLKIILMFFYYPVQLTKMTGKPVHFARFWDAK